LPSPGRKNVWQQTREHFSAIHTSIPCTNVSFLPIFGKYGWETTFPGYPYLENTARKQCFARGYTLIQQT
jgi:hypothetical protein